MRQRRSGSDQTAPPVNGDKEEQPYDVNEVPVPGRGFEAEMFFLCEVHLETKQNKKRD